MRYSFTLLINKNTHKLNIFDTRGENIYSKLFEVSDNII